ncbi:hypothetical protein PHYBOEH_003827 [Phytophthora boehmeriae]|uniref:Protein kinase domain-containing protein n=1 Tax=Phytophthora boehmeriae TaxID=109152 RepID=A0A8T1X566_9STRA|nr:hypothetical protein PHYBOEH_003827 [Phytophthora boehmeriae]
MATSTRTLLLLLLVATLSNGSNAASCGTKGTVVLTAGSDDTEAIVVSADCEETTVDVSKDTLTASSMGIEEVQSAPDVKNIVLSLNNITSLSLADLTKLDKLTLTSNKFTSFSNLAIPDSVTFLDLSWNSITSFDGMSLPDAMTQLYLGGNPITSVSGIPFPSALTLLYIHNLELTTLKGATFPEKLQYLSVMKSGLSTLDGVTFPDALEYLDFSFNTLTSLPEDLPSKMLQVTATSNQIAELFNYTFPTRITQLNFSGNPIESIKGVTFPWDLTKLDLGDNEITTFEISRSDYSTFKALKTFNAKITQTSCSTTGAELVAVSDYSICVISDDLFQSTYGSSSTSSSSAESTTTTQVSSSNNNSTILIVVICLAAVLAVALAAFAFRTYRLRQTKDVSGMDTNNFFANNTLEHTSTHSGNPHTSHGKSGSYDTIFSGGKVTTMGGTAIESALVKYRVPANEVQIERSIAKGGFGIVFLAQYQGRSVVVKKILPEKAADDRCLSAFIEEIKLSSTLSHAKIVRFIGVSWSMLSDMAVIMEYMPNGDLDMLLKQQHDRQEMYPKEFDWYQNSSVLPAKAAIALDPFDGVTNALIVLKVTSEEKPDLGTNCPEDIRELADRCLSFNASDRPSASVAHYELRTLLKLHSAFEL